MTAVGTAGASRLTRTSQTDQGLEAASLRHAPAFEASSSSARRAVATGLPRVDRRRFIWPREPRLLAAALLSDAVQAADALQAARPRRALQACVNPERRIPSTLNDVVRLPTTFARLRRGIDRALSGYVEKPPHALRELLRTDDEYFVGSASRVLPFDAEHLSLASVKLHPQNVTKLCSVEAVEKIEDPFRWIVKPDDEVLQDLDSGKEIRPYWDPTVKGSRARMIQFLKILHRSGLLAWRRVVRSHPGVFFVAKKNNIS